MDDKHLAMLTSATGRLRVQGVINPLLWLCALTTAGYSTGVVAGREPVWPLTAAMGGSVTVTLLMYVYFAFSNPDRLQSEYYQLKKQSIPMWRRKVLSNR